MFSWTAVKTAFKAAGHFAAVNSPVICTGLAIVGLGATVVSVVKATKKTAVVVAKAEEEKGDKLTKKEFVKVAWRPCLAAIIAILATGACIIGAQFAASKQLKAMAYTMSTAIASKDAVIAEMTKRGGDKLLKESEEAVKQGRAQAIIDSGRVLETGNGEELFLDLFSNTIFKSSEAAVKSAISDYQEKYRNKGVVRIADFYMLLGWPYNELPTCGDIAGFRDDPYSHSAYNGYVPDIVLDYYKGADGVVYRTIDIRPDTFFAEEYYSSLE